MAKKPTPVHPASPRQAGPDLLAQAHLAHGRGDLARAESLYRAALAQPGREAEILANLAAICHHTGRTQPAVDMLRRALQLRPGAPDLLSNLGVMLLAMDRAAEALDCLDQALLQLPGHPVVLYNRGNALLKLGRAEDALKAYQAALARQPAYREVQGNLGVALRQLGRMEEALAAITAALAAKPGVAELHNEHGLVLRGLKRPQEAVAAFREALRLRPDYPEALNNAAVVLSRLKMLDQALQAIDRALTLRPDYLEAINNKATLLLEMNRPEEALAIGTQALARSPSNVALQVRAQALFDLNRPAEAITELDLATADSPAVAATYSMRGNALLRLGNFAEALSSHQTAVRLDPGKPNHQWNLAIAELTCGDFANGWRRYEYRWQVDDLVRDDVLQGTRWLGEADIAGRDILLYAEQGYGDTLQFCRYAPLVAARGGRVTLRVQPPLKELLETLPGVARVVANDEPPPDTEFHCPLLSLPLAFGTRLDTIPGNVPYLTADPSRVATWRTRLPSAERPRIGIVVSGNPEHKNDSNRSLPLAQFKSVLDSEAGYVLLQKALHERDRQALEHFPDLHFFGQDLRSFADTAAVIANLDLVISVDTSVAHLAGALGKPVWLMLPLAPDWRWLLERSDSPWYPTARLFRQTRFGDWTSVVEDIRAELCRRFDWPLSL
jgi:tetratricopeptide (TPR) repeat protein